jgi:SAM-dependent methyltransferase
VESLDDTAKNRHYWDEWSDEYQATHGPQLAARPLAWGTWGVPEHEVRALGSIIGKDVLELGCGAARWSVFLSESGTMPVGLDTSARQLAHAKRVVAQHGARVPLVQANAEALPFRDETFDVVFSDHGGMTFADPYLTLPEASRVLRPGGVLAFNMQTPIMLLCRGTNDEPLGTGLRRDYFRMHRIESDFVEFQLPYGEWIRLLRRHNLIIEDLIELRPPEGATPTFDQYAPYEWARRWPAEHIWKARKAA